MPVEYGRCLFKLSEALIKEGHDDQKEAEGLKDEAKIFLRRRNPDATEFGTEAAYDTFVPIFWR